MPAFRKVLFTCAAWTLGCGAACALDLHDAKIAAGPNLTAHENKAVQMLTEEVEKRTALRWPAAAAAAQGGPVISIRHANGSGPAEGFHLTVQGNSVTIQGNDERGTLFGVGRFLRELDWDHGQAKIADGLNITSSPKFPLRGHQVGYRPKVNTYDAWTPADFEQYVRDLAVFGTNAVELIPPRSDDDADSPHFHLSQIDMMVEMSRILSEYGLEVWIWYPAMDRDYSDAKTVDFALKEWGDIFRRLPRVDAVFVPGGDPGHSQPKYLMALLEKEKRVLNQYHPKGQMWVSPQNFNQEWLDEFLGILKTQPAWLDGVVYGPWVRTTIQDLRAKVPARYPIRYYPDITHSIHAELNVPDWDLAYALTEAREGINPRPLDEQKAFRYMMPSAAYGFLTYSEGVNDDVNKFVWSGLGWDPDQDVGRILREFGRYFIQPKFEDGVAEGLLSLERDWHGPLLPNASVENTLEQMQTMERNATSRMLMNWRFQQMLYRAYYDGYVRSRLINETALETQARERLRQAPKIGSARAGEEACNILDRAVLQPVAEDLRSRLSALAEALYQTIHMQLSVDLYKGLAISRGSNLDTADFPLNNRIWMEQQLEAVRKQDKEIDRLAAISAMLNRTNPGPGGFYDDLGNPSMQPHLVPGPSFADDPGNFRSVRSSYAAFSGGLIGRSSLDAIRPDGPARFLQRPMALWDWAETRYETPLTMRYEHLDPQGAYKVRVVFAGGSSGPKVRLLANQSVEVHPFIARPAAMEPAEFDIPAAALRSGTLTLQWILDSGQGGFNSSVDIAEVFLIRK